MNFWRNVEVKLIDGHWHARGEWVCGAEGGTVYPFDHTFELVSGGDLAEEKRRAEFCVSDIL